MKPSIVAFLLLLTTLTSRFAAAQPNTNVNERLHIISTLTVNGNYVDIPKDSVLRKYLKIELINEDEFLLKQKTKVNWLVEDTAKFRKKKGVLRLPTTAGTKTFTDKQVDDDGRKEFFYMGQFAALNSYLVRSMYWEDMEYILVSKKDGATTDRFTAVPFLSPDKKKIITAYGDAFDTYTEIAIFSNVNATIKNTVTVTFENWMPAADDLIFWGKDGKLYMAIQYPETNLNDDGSHKTDNYQFIRMSLL